MAKFRITGPDGGTYEITAPDDASEQDVMAYAQRNAGMTKATKSAALEEGNIDLRARPVVRNQDGSISTVRSMSANIDGKETLLPTVSDDGRIVSPQEAIDNFRRTGKHLGKFETPEAATAYAQQLHTDQERLYRPSPRQAEDQSMAALTQYQKSPEATMQSLPKGLRVPLQTLRDSVTGIGQGATFNFGDEIQAGLATPLEMLRNKTTDVGASYDSALANARGEQKLAETRSPVANTIGQIGGGMAAGGTAQAGALPRLIGAPPIARGGGLTLLNAAKPTVGSMALRGAGEGAAYGAAYGFGGGEGFENRIDQAAKQGGLGALTGGVMGGFAGRSAQKTANATIPNTQQLKAAGNQAYQEADQAGLVIAPQSFSDAVDDIAIRMQSEGMDKTIHPKALAALTRLTEAQGGQPSLREIDTLRRVVKSAGASIDPSERRLANIMTEKLDDFVGNLKPTDVVAGDAIKATSALNKGRDLWSRMRKSEIIEEAITKAQNRAASTGSGGNVDNAIRQNIRGILDNPKRSRGFTQEERDLMRKVVRGGPVQNIARLVGKLSPEGNGLMMMIHGAGGVASGGATLPLAAVGFGAKKFADSATPRNVDALSRAIRSGGSLPQPQMLPAQQRALLDAVIRGGGQGGGLLD